MSSSAEIILTLKKPGNVSIGSFSSCTTQETSLSPGSSSMEPPPTSPTSPTKKRKNLADSSSDSFNASLFKKEAKSPNGNLRNTIKHMIAPEKNSDCVVQRSDQNQSYDQFVDLDDLNQQTERLGI